MCGIAGIVSAKGGIVSTDRVLAMMDSLRRRGPDAEGIHAWPRVVLGHRRLSVFDLSDAGRQPMVSADGQVGIVFNGAIYNFRELKTQLDRAGDRFRSETDTEVLLAGYLQWGLDELVRRAQGMFAFAIWDERVHKLSLVRDRLGVKPLVYLARGDELAFASTARALSRSVRDPEVDEHAVAQLLERGYIPDHSCIFREFCKVLPGTIVEWSEQGIAQRTYWKPPAPLPENTMSFAEAVDRTEHLFVDAVRRRLDADVPVAALLSGGIDSALVCWAMAHAGANIAAYTVAVPGHAEDESEPARLTAAALGVRHHVLSIESDVVSLMSDVADAFGEPFAAASALGMLAVSKAIKSEATVVLTGDGGDDIFLGYPRHRYLHAAELVAKWIPEQLATKWTDGRHRWRPSHGPLRRAAHFLDYATGGLGAFLEANESRQYHERHALLGPRLRDVRSPNSDIAWSAKAGRRVLLDHLEHVMTQQFTGEYLTKVDGATMHHGLEARSPFLDQSLWEFGAALRPALRLHRWKLKAIPRAIAARRIGSRVAMGRKRGFEIPVGRWLAADHKGSVHDTISEVADDDDGWISPQSLHRQFASEAKTGNVSQQLWYMCALHSWLRSVKAERAAGRHMALI